MKMRNINIKQLLVFITYFLAHLLKCNCSNLGCSDHVINNHTRIGKLIHGRCQHQNIFLRLFQMSLLECVKQCHLTSQCKSINYRHEWNVCDINGPSTEGLGEEIKCVYSDIISWPQVDVKTCSRQFCDSLPGSPNATCVEKFGLFRNVGYRIKFRCDKGLIMEGPPYAVCQRSGAWRNMFSCVNKPCGDVGWKEYGGQCYLRIPSPMSWDDGQSFCVKNGGRLPVIDNAKKNAWIRGVAEMLDGYFYIAVREYGNGQFVVVDENGNIIPLMYSNWNDGEPNRGKENQYCASSTGIGWNDSPCRESHYAVCERIP